MLCSDASSASQISQNRRRIFGAFPHPVRSQLHFASCAAHSLPHQHSASGLPIFHLPSAARRCNSPTLICQSCIAKIVRVMLLYKPLGAVAWVWLCTGWLSFYYRCALVLEHKANLLYFSSVSSSPRSFFCLDSRILVQQHCSSMTGMRLLMLGSGISP